jgi:nicotinamidase-related amidase
MVLTIDQTTPYAWPYDGNLVPARSALLVVTPRVGPGVQGTVVASRVDAIARQLTAVGGTVIQVVTVPPAHDPCGTEAAFLPLPERTIRSQGIDGFYGSSLDPLLRREGIDQLLLAGAGLETCIHSTMRSANDRGYECLLVLDACLAYDDSLLDSARSQVEMSGGIFGAVGSTEHVLAALAAYEEGTTA